MEKLFLKIQKKYSMNSKKQKKTVKVNIFIVLYFSRKNGF